MHFSGTEPSLRAFVSVWPLHSFVSCGLKSVRKKGRRAKDCGCVVCGVCSFSEDWIGFVLDGLGPSKHLSVTYLVPDYSWYITFFHKAAETSLASKVLGH